MIIKKKDVLFYVTANEAYHHYIPSFVISALLSNPDSLVEVAIDQFDIFKEKYGSIIEFYDRYFPKRVLLHKLEKSKEVLNLCLGKRHEANTYRFVVPPYLKAKYVYITDIDVIILKNVKEHFLPKIKYYGLDFFNVKRPQQERLNGQIQFIEYKKMYPPDLKNLKITHEDNQIGRDEHILYCMMKAKNYKILCKGVEENGKNFYFLEMPNGEKKILDTSKCKLSNMLSAHFHISHSIGFLFRSVSPFDIFDISKKVLRCSNFLHIDGLKNWLYLVKENPLYQNFFEAVGKIENEKAKEEVAVFFQLAVLMAYFAVEQDKIRKEKP